MSPSARSECFLSHHVDLLAAEIYTVDMGHTQMYLGTDGKGQAWGWARAGDKAGDKASLSVVLALGQNGGHGRL